MLAYQNHCQHLIRGNTASWGSKRINPQPSAPVLECLTITTTKTTMTMKNLFHKGLCKISLNAQIMMHFKKFLKINFNIRFRKEQLHTGEPVLPKNSLLRHALL